MNTIWNENELKKIKTLLRKYNLTLDENNTIIENKQSYMDTIPHHQIIKVKY